MSKNPKEAKKGKKAVKEATKMKYDTEFAKDMAEKNQKKK